MKYYEVSKCPNGVQTIFPDPIVGLHEADDPSGHYKWVQVIDGRPVQAFTEDEVLVRDDKGKPTTSEDLTPVES